MNSLLSVVLMLVLGLVAWTIGDRLSASGRRRVGNAMRGIGVVVGIYSFYAWQLARQSSAATKISASLEILETRIKEDDKRGALEIIDRGIRYFGRSSNLNQSADSFFEFAKQISEKAPNKAPEPTPVLVTPRALE